MTRLWLCLIAIVFVMSIRDVFTQSDDGEGNSMKNVEGAEKEREQGNIVEEAETIAEEEEIIIRDPSMHPSPKYSMGEEETIDYPTLKFEFCTSCGYKAAFTEMSDYVTTKYPGMNIEEGNYAVSPERHYGAMAISFLRSIFFFLIISGSNPFQIFHMDCPQWLKHAHENKISSMLMVFLLSNTASTYLLSSGAFEVHLGEQLIWSKLESGRMPTGKEFGQILHSHLELLGKVPRIQAVASSAFNEFAEFDKGTP